MTILIGPGPSDYGTKCTECYGRDPKSPGFGLNIEHRPSCSKLKKKKKRKVKK